MAESAAFFLVRCPNCKNAMKYHTRTNTLAGKAKKCVYCGKSFGVRLSVQRQIG